MPRKSAFAPLALCAAVAALGGCLQRITPERTPAQPAPATFALVAYTAAPDGALHADTLDSGLSPSDCAFALGAAARMGPAIGEALITCELETGR